MKKILAIIFLVNSFNVYSQTEKIFFLKNDGSYIKNKEDADFMRVVNQPDSGSALYNITEYYPNSVKKLVGTASIYWPKIIWEGPCITYDKKGQKVQYMTYSNGSPMGSAYYFYSSGRLMKELEYGKFGLQVLGNKSLRYKIINYYDSTGVQLIKDGTGYLKEIRDKRVAEEGNYVNGLRDGIWKGTMGDDGSFEDVYDDGKFISGRSFRPHGEIIKYTVKDILPEFPGGGKAFSQFLSRNIKYPPEARTSGISGRVILTFTVEKDGELTGVKVVKSPDYSLEEEALRVLNRSPKWEPGIQNGIPVRVQYTLPITFSVSR